jgi:outer membrane biosynthesis protein TonB
MDTRLMSIRTPLLAAAVAGLLLGGCHKQREPEPENQTTETPAPVVPEPAPAPEPVEAPTPKPVAPKPKAAPKPSADEQMLDDADATGMTSHANRETDASDGAGNSQQ